MQVWCRWILLCLILGSVGTAQSRSFPHTPDPTLDSQQRWGVTFQSYVYAGCLPGVSPTRSITIPPCRAFVRTTDDPMRLVGFEEETARTVTLPAGSTALWLGGRPSPGVQPAGWTCFPGTHYCTMPVYTAGQPPPGVVLLARLVLVGEAVTEVGDVRVDAPLPGPANLRSPLYGAVGDCSASDHEAVQTWINNTAWRRVSAYAPAGCYLIDQVWLNYDQAANPSYPSDALFQGNYELRGDGALKVFHVGVPYQRQMGTVFRSTATGGPAFTAFSPMGEGNPNALRGLRLSGFAVEQTTSSAVMVIDGANESAWLKGVFIAQRGTGDGLIYRNTFLSTIEDVFVYTDNAANSGLGVQIANATGIGGIVEVKNVTGRGFGVACIRFGSTATEGKTLASVHAHLVQGNHCPVGIQIWGALSGFVGTGIYTEVTTETGIDISQNALGVTLNGGYVSCDGHTDATDAGIRIGRATGAFTDRARGVTIHGMRVFRIQKGFGILRDYSAETDGTVILGNEFSALDGSTGIGIGCGAGGTTTENNLVIAGNSFNQFIPTEVDASCRSGELIQTRLGLWMGRRVNLGQGQVVVASDEIVLPTNGNTYNLVGTILVRHIDCGPCTPGATVTFFVQPGSTPQIGQGGNIDLDDTRTNPWQGEPGALISFMFDGTNWRETGRKAP